MIVIELLAFAMVTPRGKLVVALVFVLSEKHVLPGRKANLVPEIYCRTQAALTCNQVKQPCNSTFNPTLLQSAPLPNTNTPSKARAKNEAKQA